MGIRGEIFSTRVILQNRTYFFNVKENRMGDLYLNIVESKNQESGGFERQSVILFADDLSNFLSGFEESLRALEKAGREKRRGAGKRSGGWDEERPSFPPKPKRVVVRKQGAASGKDSGGFTRGNTGGGFRREDSGGFRREDGSGFRREDGGGFRREDSGGNRPRGPDRGPRKLKPVRRDEP
ncbi:MAG: DUF3276 family protein [Treponema sp.]|jgi:hypothetical protein|nr:DUF3276 family protein [Treponema sp.]